ncbi:TPA: hypothetical protein ACIK0B_001775 [Campylobacter jejuni]|nr:hypothetical protein [Campylobacter jejuni]GKY28538.1 hypothetical protein THJ062_18060 [Campylobacter jejuni]
MKTLCEYSLSLKDPKYNFVLSDYEIYQRSNIALIILENHNKTEF